MLKLVLEGDDPPAGLDGQFLLVVGEVALAVLGVRDDTLDERGTLLDFLLQTHDHGVAVVTGHGAGSFRVRRSITVGRLGQRAPATASLLLRGDAFSAWLVVLGLQVQCFRAPNQARNSSRSGVTSGS